MESVASLLDHTKRYNIPVDHLDYKYIEKCKDVKELEKILKILRSGEEGKFPDLENFCEKRLVEVAPQSHLLRKSKPLLKPSDVDRATKDEYTTELKNWLDEVKSASTDSMFSSKQDSEKPLPPVRQRSGFATNLTPKEVFYSDKTKQVSNDNPPKTMQPTNKDVTRSNKRVLPRDYNEWAKLERELGSSDDEAAAAAPSKPNSTTAATKSTEKSKCASDEVTKVSSSRTVLSHPVAPTIAASVSVPPGTSEKERQSMALREKDKGNEAFNSGDLDEALLYYNRSLSICPIATVYNNRALIYSKKKMWHEVIKDTTRVIEEEPQNLKALLRRAHAFTEIHSLKKAVVDLELVLSLEPENARAKALLGETRKEEERREQSRLAGGRRIAIVEEGSSSEEESEPEECTMKVDEDANISHENGHPCLGTGDSAQPTQVIETIAESSSGASEPSRTQDIWNRQEIAAGHGVSDSTTSPPVSDVNQNISPFLLAKEKGNEEFRKGNYKAALQHYNECIELEPENAIGYKNRSLCHLKLEMHSDAIYDCNMALELNPECAQSFYRRGMARKMQGDYEDALKDVEKAQLYLADNESIAEELTCLRELYKKHPRGERMVEEVFDKDVEEEPSTVKIKDEPPRPKDPEMKAPEVQESASTKTEATEVSPVSKSVEVSSPTPVETPPVINLSSTPITKGFEFSQGWNELKSVNYQPQYVAHFLKRFTTPSTMSQIISNQLDPTMLENIFLGLAWLAKDSQEYVFISQFMQHLVKVPRFKMNKLLLPISAMIELQTVLHTLLNEDIISQETYQTFV